MTVVWRFGEGFVTFGGLGGARSWAIFVVPDAGVIVGGSRACHIAQNAIWHNMAV
jgi:hypothetical protein